jgi:fused signal recognition particle receptor
MVFDWFNRGQAPQNPQPAAPEPAPEPPQADESVAAGAPAADPAPEQPSVSVPAPGSPSAPAGVDQDALEWARQAYARLKAQQEAERQAAQARGCRSRAASGGRCALRECPGFCTGCTGIGRGAGRPVP